MISACSRAPTWFQTARMGGNFNVLRLEKSSYPPAWGLALLKETSENHPDIRVEKELPLAAL